MTVASTMRPLLALPSPFWAMTFLISSKALWAALAACSSCGRNRVPFSYLAPTMSSAGISASSTTSSGCFSASSALVWAAASPFRPFSTAFISGA